MIFDLLILALVLGYSAWLILRAVRRRWAGQTGGCCGCSGGCCGCSSCGCGSAGKEAGHTHG